MPRHAPVNAAAAAPGDGTSHAARAVAPAVPGLVIGGTGSNAGKTSFTLALLCALRRRGLTARAAKTGPDYIDAAFHAALTGQPAANLDTWMCREAAPSPDEQPLRAGRGLPPGLQRIFQRMTLPGTPQGAEQKAPDQISPPPGQSTQGLLTPGQMTPDLLVVEGAMGLFDGGHKGAGCTAHLAALLELPVLLVLHAGGMGQSAAALAEGFLRHRPAWSKGPVRFLGMVCTHVGSARHADLLREVLAPLGEQAGAPLLGLLPRQGAPELSSRHLGLVEAREALPEMDRTSLALWIEAHCDLDRLLALTKAPGTVAMAAPLPSQPRQAVGQPQSARFFPPAPTKAKRKKRTLTVGLAWDAAFSFCYADLPALLGELGAEVRTFSPLRDAAPPAGCAGLYFPGGYPELHARDLAANTPLHEALRALARQGMPIYGECGGYMYLMRSLRTAGAGDEAAPATFAMSGLLPRTCAMGEAKAALGYRAGLALENWPEPAHGRPQPENAATPRPLWVRGHEFHYAREEQTPLPPHCAPLWKLHDSRGRFLRDEGCRLGSVAGSWLHCYPEGARRFWRAWLRACAAYLRATP